MRKKNKVRYFVPYMFMDGLFQCDSLEHAEKEAGIGQSIYKTVEIGSVDVNGKYHPIKRRKK